MSLAYTVDRLQRSGFYAVATILADGSSTVRPRAADTDFRRTASERYPPSRLLVGQMRRSDGGSEPIHRHAGPFGMFTSPAAAAAAGAVAVSQSDVEDEVSGELDRLAEVQENDGRTIDVELRVAERLNAYD